MPVYQSGPFNIQEGNSASFVVEFLSSNEILTVPSTTNFTVTYTNTAFATQVDTVTLTEVNSYFNGTWSSTSAALGLAVWSVTATGSTLVQDTGQLRIISRQSTL